MTNRSKSSSSTVDVIIPTRNRAQLIVGKVSNLLRDEHVSRIIVVTDGCEDDTVSRLESLREERVEIVALEKNLGLPAARNAGIERARSEWILLTDDDDFLSDNFLCELLEVASLAHADVIGAPWIHLRPAEDIANALARTPKHGNGPKIDRPSRIPESRWQPNIWFTPNMVVSRKAALLKFDVSYRGNFYREDSDFIVRAARAGFKPVVAGDAYSYTGSARVGGGIKRDTIRLRLRYEYWALRNTLQFFLRHGSWIYGQGFGNPVVLTVRFLGLRIWFVVGGRLKRLGRWFK